ATVVPTDWTGEPDSRLGSPDGSGMTPRRGFLGNLARRGSSRASPQRRRDLDRTEKRDFVAGLHDALSGVAMVVVTQNKGLTVAEATELRRRMRASGATFRIAKNRLTNLALEGTPFDGLRPLLKGPTALAWAQDPVAVAKTTVEFARTNERFVLIGGSLGPRTLDAAGVRALAELPRPDRGDDFHPRHPDRRHPPGTGRTTRAGFWRLRQEG